MDGKMYVKITPEIIEKASDYIPLMEKQKMAETIGQKCVARVQMTMVGADGQRKSLPDRYQEMQVTTNLYLMGILAKCYLHIPYDGDGDTQEDNPYYGLQMAANMYDVWGCSHVMNQLEQLKMDKNCKDKVYNILYDYRKLQRMISAEIELAVGHQNDVVWRLLDAMDRTVKEGVMEGMASVAERPETETGAADKAQQIAKAKEYLDALEGKVSQLSAMSQTYRKKLEEMEREDGADA